MKKEGEVKTKPMTQEKNVSEKLRDMLLKVHKEYRERNGLPYCKNCGVDHEWLAGEIEKLNR